MDIQLSFNDGPVYKPHRDLVKLRLGSPVEHIGLSFASDLSHAVAVHSGSSSNSSAPQNNVTMVLTLARINRLARARIACSPIILL